MSARYDGLEFRTPLEAQWAAFFDLVGWRWRVSPAAVDNWRPDFEVCFESSHPACSGSLTLLVAVLPIEKLSDFKGHPCLSRSSKANRGQPHWVADAGAAFGMNPSVTKWLVAGKGSLETFDVHSLVDDADELWAAAGNQVAQLRPCVIR